MTRTALDRIAPRRPRHYHSKLMQWDGGSGNDGSGGGGAAGVSYSGHIGSPKNAAFLRNWPLTNVWIYSAITMRCHQVSNADFNIVQIDPQKTVKESVRNDITNLLTRPNGTGREKSWRLLMSPITYDLSTLDAGVIQKILLGSGAPDALKILDGARMIPSPTWGDDQDGPRYMYMDKSGTGHGKPFMDDEVVFMQSNPLSHTPFGLSPLQVLHKILMAEYHAFQSMYVTQRNRAPGGIMIVPNSSPETINTIRDLLDNELNGMGGVGVMDVPADSRFQAISSINLQEQGAFAFYDMLIKAIATAFRTTTLALNWMSGAGATAREQAELMDDGLVSLLEMIQDYINAEIVAAFPGSDNLEFQFLKLASRDEAQQASTLRTRMGNATNWMALREARKADGLSEIIPANEWERRWLEEPFVPAGTGLSLPYSVAAEQYAPQAQLGGSLADLDQQTGEPGPLPGSGGQPALAGNAPAPDTMPVNIRRLAMALAQLPPGGKLPSDIPQHNRTVIYPAAAVPASADEEVRSHEEQLLSELDNLFSERMAQERSDYVRPSTNGHHP